MEKAAQNAYCKTKEQILSSLDSQEQGISEDEAKSRLTKFGKNVITTKKKISVLSIYLNQFKNSLILILIGAVFLILFIYYFGQKETSDLIEAGLILAIIFMITALGFIQEFKAEKSIEALKKLLAFKAKVRRDGIEKEIDVVGLVPGDIVVLEEGIKVPADIRLLEVYSLQVNEASLTGESGSVSKNNEVISGNKQINDQKNMVFSGTSIASGRGIGIVIDTGDTTELGKIAEGVAQSEETKTPIQEKLDKIGKSIGYVVLAISFLVFIFVVFFANDFTSLPLIDRVVQSFVVAVALAVAAIPEGLPAVVTISLALGTRRMLKKNALVRKLNSVETLGSTDVICSDKTGTLTKGEMTVREIYFDGKFYTLSGAGYEKVGKFSVDKKDVHPEDLSLILRTGLECNNATVANNKVAGDPTEAALIVSANKAGFNSKLTRILEIPFSSERKMMSVVIRDGQKYIVYTKGAPKDVVSKCSDIIKNGKAEKLTSASEQEIVNSTLAMSQKALRTLGFAYKEISKDQFEKLKKNLDKLESALTFIGLQGMIDPPRVEIKPLIESCNESGIRVIMITGDHAETAKAVAAEIGIIGNALTGEELDNLSDKDFQKAVESVNIYARVDPNFKKRIVDVLEKNKHVVAMTGDGVNDAPALKKADIGIAMGITGTDVAKEASDMVLLNDNFSTIIYAIEEGRGIFHNIRKFVTYLLSCNIGEVLVVLFGIVIFQKLVLSATMLLWINVITDGIPAIALGLDPAEKGILKKKAKLFQTEIIEKRIWIDMIIFGVMLTVAVLGIYLIELDKGVETAKGIAFTSIVFFELIYLFIIRSRYKISLFSNPGLLWAVVAAVLLQLIIVYVPFFAKLFEIKGVAIFDWFYVLVFSVLIWAAFSLSQAFLDRINFMSKGTIPDL